MKHYYQEGNKHHFDAIKTFFTGCEMHRWRIWHTKDGVITYGQGSELGTSINFFYIY